jgi:peptidoglycan-N-acetylglucosamine deacetylase
MTPLIWSAAALGGGAALGYAASCFAEVRGLHDWLVPGSIWRTERAHAVLTFDDGPDPEVTPRLLDLLAAHEQRAVFFVVGERVAREPALVRRMVTEGHLVGNHSWSHPWLVRLSRRRIREEFERCQRAIEDAAGVSPSYARPPYGQRDFRVNGVLRELGLTSVLWSRNLRDYHGSGPEVLARRLGRVRPGEVVLCHDGDPLAEHTLEGLERWLPGRTTPLGLF